MPIALPAAATPAVVAPLAASPAAPAVVAPLAAAPASSASVQAPAVQAVPGAVSFAATRRLRLVALENLVETGYAVTLPDTGYAGTVLIGRQDLAGGVVVDLDLTDAGGHAKRVSRRQAQLGYANGLITLSDWQSAHGTWVNKRRLAPGEGAVLADGDELRLADFVFRVELR
jgi:hypothetical protein